MTTHSERVRERIGECSQNVDGVHVGRSGLPGAVTHARGLVDGPLRAAVDRLENEQMRLVAGYQLGLWNATGEPDDAGGKALRPALVLLAARAASGSPEPGIPAAVAVELVHNFSLLHDDIMDRDVERRHRPTGWVVYGEGQAILAGNAMLTAAVETLLRDDPRAARTVPLLLATVQRLISGQSEDLALEGERSVELEDVLAMEEGKTAALIAASLALGACAADADQAAVDRLCEFGRLLGLAFQIVDDVLGIVGDSSVTGKSASSDIRAGKRSAPVVAALNSGTDAGRELGELLLGGPPQTDAQIARAVALIEAAGGLAWAAAESECLLERAIEQLHAARFEHHDAVRDLEQVARFLVRRDW